MKPQLEADADLPWHDLDRLASRFTKNQHGLITRTQLMASGASPRRIQSWLTRGRLRRLHRGVYLVGSIVPPLAGPLAACLTCGPSAVVSHRTAAILWDLTTRRSGDREIVITVTGPNRRAPGVRVHRSRTLRPDERTSLNGVPITTATRTLLDLAITARARVLERAVAEALARGLTTESRVADCLRRHDTRAGSAPLRAILEHGPPALTRSEAEERFLDLVRRAGMPPPRVNTRIGPHEVDFHWPGARLVVEIDGFASHHSSRAFERDRRRDGYLIAEGLRVMRITWRQLESEPEGIAFRLGRALAPQG